jgi:AraC-like DNA-binding protein
MSDQVPAQNDININLAGGPSKVPEIHLLLVSEDSWQRGYSSRSHTGDHTWVALATTEGSGHLWMVETPDDQPIVVNPNSFILFREERLVEYKVVSDRWINHWYQFEIDGPWILPQEQVLNTTLDKDYHTQFNFIHEQIANTSAAMRRRVTSQFSAMLFQWIDESDLPPSDWDQNHPVQKAVDLMTQHLHKRISMEQVAESIGLSTTQLRKVFLRDLQATPIKYYNWMRMYEARTLLVQGRSVGDVADLLDYSDQFHFTRAFKSHFSRSPSQILRDLKLDE